MSTVQYYEIHCDETYLRGHGSEAFAFGALICSPRRSEILREALKEVRVRHNYQDEVKWRELSRQTLSISLEFVEVFFADHFAKFAIRSVRKGHSWNGWGKSEEERFFKAYHHFLKRWTGPFSRYDIYPDERPLQKNYRWKTLHFLINRSRRYEWNLRQRNIRTFEPTDSASEDLLQLTDLLLGGLTSTAQQKEKDALCKHIACHATAKTRYGSNKVTIEEGWTPRVSK